MKKILSLILTMCIIASICTFMPLNVAATSGTCGDNISWKIENGVLTFTGSGSIEWESTSEPNFNEYDFTKVVFDDRITELPTKIFRYCNKLSEVTLPKNLVYVPYEAFYGCSSLRNIVIPDKVAIIESSAFKDVPLETVTIPQNTLLIGKGAFDGPIGWYVDEVEYTGIKDVYYKGTQNQWNNIKIISGNDDINPYSTGNISLTNATKHFNDNISYSGKCGENATWEISDQVLHISGTGEINSYCGISKGETYPIWLTYDYDTIKIDEGITGIGMCAFDETIVGINNSGWYSFGDVSDEEITANGLTKSDSGFLYFCIEKVESIYLPKSLTGIGAEAFYKCKKLKDVYYSGTETEWKNVENYGSNDSLDSATMHYSVDNTTTPDIPTTPDNPTTDNIKRLNLNTKNTTIEKNNIISSDGDERSMDYFISTDCWSNIIQSYIYQKNQNNFSVLDVTDENIYVDTYDSDSYNKIDTKEISYELQMFGGFYSGEQYNYIVFGQPNESESDSKEVLRVVKYDKEFNKISSVSINDCFTILPFEFGSLRMAEKNNELTIHTSRLRYLTEDGLNHQSQLTLRIDTESMSLINNTSEFQDNHVSHSFNQFVKYDLTNHILVDHGDAYPRSVVLNKFNGNDYTEIELFKIPGEIGANCTGVTVGGFEISSNNYLVAINTIDHGKVSKYTSYEMEGLSKDERDIVLLINSKSNTDSDLVQKIYFTNYVNNNKSGSTPYLVKINETKYAILWEEYKNINNSGDYDYSGVKYVFIDENANALSDILYDKNAVLSADCQPLLLNDKIMWYVNNGDDSRTLYSINAEEYTKESQTITVDDFSEKTYGDGEFNISVTPDATSNLDNFTYASDNKNVATISEDGTITIVGAGEANISVTEAGNDNYAKTTVTKKLTVKPKEITITSIDVENKTAVLTGILTADESDVTLDFDKITLIIGDAVDETTSNAVLTNFVLKGGKAANYNITTETLNTTVANENVVSVEIMAENGSATGAAKYLKNSEVTVVATPNSGYTFSGWYNGNTLVSTSPIYTFTADSNVSLVARFAVISSGNSGSRRVSTYTVKFETNGGSKIDSVKVDKNKTVTEPTAPTKDGFEFAGWYADKALTTKYDFDTKVTKNITLYAKWSEDEIQEPSDDNKDDEPQTDGRKNPFDDVSENDWFYESVKYVNENGLMNGISNNVFAPNDNITRGMFVTVLWRAEGEPDADFAMPFTDIDENAYYAEAVRWAASENIVNGITETEFAPDMNIAREQIAAILYRYAQYKGYDVSVGEDTNILSYTDFDEISEYAIEAVQYAVGSGLMKGKTESTLNPKDFATRAEVAAILKRFIEANK